MKQRNNILEMVRPAILQLQPHSIVFVILHSWLEYFDQRRGFLYHGNIPLLLLHRFLRDKEHRLERRHGISSREHHFNRPPLLARPFSLSTGSQELLSKLPLRLKRVSLTCPLPILYIYKGNRYFFQDVST